MLFGQPTMFLRDITAILLLLTLPFSRQQADDSNSGYDDGSSSDDGSSDDGSDDDCALISGHTCNPTTGICKYCAMCIQSSCILTKSASATANASLSENTPVCNSTQLGTTDLYDWYGYCLSSGNDSDGDYCATSLECYQYRKNTNASSVSYVWQNLTCDPNSCLLMTDRGQPPPAPGQLPPAPPTTGDNNGGGSSSSGGSERRERGHHHESNFADRSPTAIALTVTCSFIFLVGMLWIGRVWFRARKQRRGRQSRDGSSSSSSSSVPSTGPPSFRSNPEMRQASVRRGASNSSFGSSQASSEPLPSYFSPDPSPPKYEQAIVTQIRELACASSSSRSEEQETEEGHSLPPPLWLPVYFTPNHSAFSFGRLRRHPPPHLAASSSSSNSNSHTDWSSDPLRAFWYHHQQQMQNRQPPQPSASTSCPTTVSTSTSPAVLIGPGSNEIRSRTSSRPPPTSSMNDNDGPNSN